MYCALNSSYKNFKQFDISYSNSEWQKKSNIIHLFQILTYNFIRYKYKMRVNRLLKTEESFVIIHISIVCITTIEYSEHLAGFMETNWDEMQDCVTSFTCISRAHWNLHPIQAKLCEVMYHNTIVTSWSWM